MASIINRTQYDFIFEGPGDEGKRTVPSNCTKPMEVPSNFRIRRGGSKDFSNPLTFSLSNGLNEIVMAVEEDHDKIMIIDDKNHVVPHYGDDSMPK